MGLREDLLIDEFDLVNEWLHQSELFADYAKIESEAARDLAKAKERLEVIRADIVLDIHKDPSKYNLKKSTEVYLNAAISHTEKYKEAKQAVFDAQYEKDMAGCAVRSMDSRKRALENIVKLYGQNYYSEPSTDAVSPKAASEIKDKSAKEMHRERRRAERRKKLRGAK